MCVSVCLKLFVCDCVLSDDTMKEDISGVMEGTDLPQKKRNKITSPKEKKRKEIKIK